MYFFGPPLLALTTVVFRFFIALPTGRSLILKLIPSEAAESLTSFGLSVTSSPLIRSGLGDLEFSEELLCSLGIKEGSWWSDSSVSSSSES